MQNFSRVLESIADKLSIALAEHNKLSAEMGTVHPFLPDHLSALDRVLKDENITLDWDLYKRHLGDEAFNILYARSRASERSA